MQNNTNVENNNVVNTTENIDNQEKKTKSIILPIDVVEKVRKLNNNENEFDYENFVDLEENVDNTYKVMKHKDTNEYIFTKEVEDPEDVLNAIYLVGGVAYNTKGEVIEEINYPESVKSIIANENKNLEESVNNEEVIENINADQGRGSIKDPAPPSGFESPEFKSAATQFDQLTSTSLFSKPEMIEEIKANFKKYQDMGKEEGWSNEEIQSVFKMDYLDRAYLVSLKQVVTEQMELNENERISMATLVTEYDKVQNQLYKALQEEGIAPKLDEGVKIGTNKGPQIKETIMEVFKASNTDLSTPNMVQDITSLNKKLDEWDNDLPSESEVINKDNENVVVEQQEYKFEKSFENELKAFEQVTHIHLEIDDVKAEFDRIRGLANGLEPEAKARMLESAYNNFYKTNLTNALYTNDVNRKDGTSFLGPQMVANSFDRLMSAIDKEATKAGIIKGDYQRDNPETVSAETKYATTLRFCIDPSDRTEAKNVYKKAKNTQEKIVNEDFHKEILDFNAANGTKFSSKYIIAHLAKQFKSGEETDFNEMKENFPKKYQEFLLQAYTNMLSKMDMNDGKTIAEKSKAFDTFTQKLENVLKQKGWIDMDHRHEPFGGLNPDSMQKAQLDELGKRPQTTQLEAENSIDTGNMKDIRKKMEELCDKVPERDKDGMNSIEAHTLVNYLRAVDKRHSARGFFNVLRHPLTNGRERRTMKAIQSKLEEKGYQRTDLENLIKNPLTEEQDPIAIRRNNEVNAINAQHQSNTYNLNKSIEANQVLEDTPEMNFRKKIEVKECDNRKEISNPQGIVSKPVDPTKNKEKETNIQINNNNK